MESAQDRGGCLREVLGSSQPACYNQSVNSTICSGGMSVPKYMVFKVQETTLLHTSGKTERRLAVGDESHAWGLSSKASWKQIESPVHPAQMAAPYSPYPTQNYEPVYPEVPVWQPSRLFGCQFRDKPYFVWTSPMLKPVYGNTVEPLVFDSTGEFMPLLRDIGVTYSQVKYDHIWTNIPAFYDFYDEYKKQGSGNLSSFFDRYEPRFFPAQEHSTVAVDLLEKLTRAAPNIANSVHLVTCHVNAGEELFKSLKIKDTTSTVAKCKSHEPPCCTFTHGHVAALLRIRISRRLGYVLMDPALIEGPVVIMEDGQHPLQNKFQFSEFFLRGPNYIFAKNIRNQKNIYYIGKPYCSFLMTTNKLDILMDTRKRMEYSHLAGGPSANTASFEFDVTQRQPAFKMSLHTSVNSGDISVAFGTRHWQRSDMYYNTVLQTINYPGVESLLAKAETIAQDKQFVGKLVELYSHYYKQIHPNEQFNGNSQMYDVNAAGKIPSVKIPPPGGLQSTSIAGIYPPQTQIDTSGWTFYHD